jgi:hypothetical protein
MEAFVEYPGGRGCGRSVSALLSFSICPLFMISTLLFKPQTVHCDTPNLVDVVIGDPVTAEGVLGECVGKVKMLWSTLPESEAFA